MNSFNAENTKLFNTLKLLGIRIKRFTEFDALYDTYSDLTTSADPDSDSPLIKLICSASLSDEVYGQLESLDEIE